MMKIDGNVFLCVCHRQVGGTCHRALKHCHFHHDLLGAVLSNAAKEEILKQNDMLRVLGHHRGKLFLRQHYSSVNLGFLFKMDHTANMKYTLCIEHLIKY